MISRFIDTEYTLKIYIIYIYNILFKGMQAKKCEKNQLSEKVTPPPSPLSNSLSLQVSLQISLSLLLIVTFALRLPTFSAISPWSGSKQTLSQLR